jgi:hypothetical protein
METRGFQPRAGGKELAAPVREPWSRLIGQGFFGVEPEVGGTEESVGSAGAGPEEEDSGASAGPVVPVPLVPDLPDLPDDPRPSSLEIELGVSAPHPEAVLRLVMTTRIIAIKIQIAAVTMVILVNVSPALVPNALEPPAPPKAPASPPPLPRWIKIRQTRNRERRMIKVLKIAVNTPTR